MVSIAINHVTGVYQNPVIGSLVFVQIRLDVDLAGCLVSYSKPSA
jgi:hypothetical protein